MIFRKQVVTILCSCALITSIGVWNGGSIYVQKNSQSDHKPDISFEHQTFDFGKVKDKMSHTFVFTNTGDESLVLIHVATGCGCTTAKYTTDSIKPGKKGKVIVSFNPTQLRAGKFRKSVTVYANIEQKYTRLFIKGEVVKE